jgi:rhodanese-related sulfurtransferase
MSTLATTLSKTLSLLFLAICALPLVGCQSSPSDKDIEFVSLAQVQAAVEGKPGGGGDGLMAIFRGGPGQVRLIDPRPPQDFDKGHIPGAVNLQLPAVSEKKDSLDPALAVYKLIIVYGSDPGSAVARAMTKRLMSAGAKEVRMFSGGYLEWTRAGLKVETGPAK